MEKSKELLAQIIKIADAQEQQINFLHKKLNQGTKAMGTTSLRYHLGLLEELIEIEYSTKPKIKSYIRAALFLLVLKLKK